MMAAQMATALPLLSWRVGKRMFSLGRNQIPNKNNQTYSHQRIRN